MLIRVKVPGSCGELIQGMMDQEPFLVTCPIDLYTEVSIFDHSNERIGFGHKANIAAAKTIAYLNIKDFSYGMKLESGLPQGKGMASSSADIAAVCQAIAVSTGTPLQEDEIAHIAASIEPTDGVFHQGVVLFNHLTGVRKEFLGHAPDIVIAVLDTGGAIDTLRFNQRQDLQKLNQLNEEKIREALDLLRRGLITNNLRLIGRGATISAQANQKILYKPYLDEVIEIADGCGALGVNVAHSGTVVGILFDMQELNRLSYTVDVIKERYPALKLMKIVRFISGGQVIEGDKTEKSRNV